VTLSYGHKRTYSVSHTNRLYPIRVGNAVKLGKKTSKNGAIIEKYRSCVAGPQYCCIIDRPEKDQVLIISSLNVNNNQRIVSINWQI